MTVTQTTAARPALAGLSVCREEPSVLSELVPAPQPQHAPRVLIAHEVRLFADVLRVALSERHGFEVLPTVVALARLVQTARRTLPQVIIMDLDGRSADGLAVLRDVRAAVPGSAVLVVTAEADAGTLAAAMSLGASGYLTMDAAMSEVVEAISATAAGKVVLSRRRLEALVRHLSRPSRDPSPCDGLLTDRERDVLARLVRGMSTTAIASDLGVTQNTARTHIQNVLTKLGVHSRLEAAARAVREQLV